MENNAAINTDMHVSFWISVSVFFRYTPRRGIAGTCHSSIFSFLKNLHTVFHRGCGILSCNLFFHSGCYKQCIKISFSPHPCQHFFIYSLLDDTILIGVRWYLIVVLICISLMIHNVEILLMCLMDICLSLEKCLFRSSSHFLISLFEGVFNIELYRQFMYFGH